MKKDTKLKKWLKMSVYEKAKYNGYKGYCENQRVTESILTMKPHQLKLYREQLRLKRKKNY